MTCDEYLALYSELLDERLDVEDELRCRTHALQCASCARYDRVMRRGLRLVRELPSIAPSSQFLFRLQHRIRQTSQPSDGDRFAASGTVVALAIAGVIAIAAWSPLLQLPDRVDRAGRDVPAAVDAGPDSGRSSRGIRQPPMVRPWYEGPRGSSPFILTDTRFAPNAFGSAPGLAPAVLGPYSPLFVSPPLRRGGESRSSRPGQ